MLLAIDTATAFGSVAWMDLETQTVVETKRFESDWQHSEALAETIQSGRVSLSRVQRYAIRIGPGSFTGLRIGVAFLKGVSMAMPRPIGCVSSLQIEAQCAFEQARRTNQGNEPNCLLLPILDARGGLVYAGSYRAGVDGFVVPHALVRDGSYPMDALQSVCEQDDHVILYGGNGAHLLPHPMERGVHLSWPAPDAGDLARVSEFMRQKGCLPERDARSLLPEYQQGSPVRRDKSFR